jgi:branched-chain amino acid transport system substrate-binding protein
LEELEMKKIQLILAGLMAVALLLSACAPAATPEPTEEPVVEQPTAAPEPTAVPPTEEAMPAGLTCEEPIKVGFITDVSGSLAIYGAHMLPSFMLGMEYATGAAGSAGDKFDFAATQENTFTLDDCEFQVFVRDDASTPDNTATVARELIDVEGVDILVGTVSSGATATLQGIAPRTRSP